MSAAGEARFGSGRSLWPVPCWVCGLHLEVGKRNVCFWGPLEQWHMGGVVLEPPAGVLPGFEKLVLPSCGVSLGGYFPGLEGGKGWVSA